MMHSTFALVIATIALMTQQALGHASLNPPVASSRYYTANVRICTVFIEIKIIQISEYDDSLSI